jgi:cytochrome c1
MEATMKVTDCAWCGTSIGVPDHADHKHSIVVCSDQCANMEKWFRATYPNERIDAHHKDGKWLKDMIGWKPTG